MELLLLYGSLFLLPIPVGLGLIAKRAQLLTSAGAVAAAFLGLLLLLAPGFGAFLMLLAFFPVITLLAGTIRRRLLPMRVSKPRNWHQVLANGGPAVLFALLFAVTSFVPFLIGLAAGIAESAGDTVSSEVGEAFGSIEKPNGGYKWKTIMITTFKPVPPGTAGGISLPGTIAGFIVSLGIALIAPYLLLAQQVVPINSFTLYLPGNFELSWLRSVALPTLPFLSSVLIGAVAGALLDSFLGAMLERRGLISNSAVNAYSSAFACVFSIFLYGMMTYWLGAT